MKTPNKFQVGRRVRLRGRDVKGVINQIYDNGNIGVQWTDGHKWNPDASIAISIEEVVLLKPRAKKVQRVTREWYKSSLENPMNIPGLWMVRISTHKCSRDDVHITEVLPGQVLVSREQLLEAWKEVNRPCKENWDPGHGSPFERLCKKLGLQENS